MISSNIFNDIQLNSKKEIFGKIFQNRNIKIERIISYGQSSPLDFWYDQEENEFVLLLDGEAKIEFEDKIYSLKGGDYLLIPSHVKHKVVFTSVDKPTIWLAIFFKGEKNG